MKPTILIEALDLSEAIIFTDGKRIENVVLIRAGMSMNRRYYSESVLEAAAPIFDGIRAYANHPRGTDKKEGRSVRDLAGWYSDVRYQEGALRATRHFFDTEAGRDTWAIAEAVVSGRAPKHIAGLSINAAGSGTMDKFDDGEALRVEAISHAYSVDDVDTPAAGGAYALTASNGDELANALIAAMTYDEFKQAHPKHLEALKNEWKAVRLEEATRSALAESDLRVKTANAQAGETQAAYIAAQTTIATLTTERDTALGEAAQASRALAIEKALRAAKLPLLYENDLRERLLQSDPATWSHMLNIEKQKAQKSAPARVPVTGASQQVQPSHTPAQVTEQRLNMRDVETPEDLQREMERLRRG